MGSSNVTNRFGYWCCGGGGAAGRVSQGFLRVFEGTQKFEFGPTKSESGLNADFEEEYSKGRATQIAWILQGSKCDVYVAFCLELPIKVV
jgi:hypothetical protein